MFWYYVAILAAMLLLGAALSAGLIRGSVINRRRFDQSLLRYEGRHAITQPREPDPWTTILRPPAPSRDPGPATVQFRALTDTGALRAITDTTNAWIAEHCPETEA
jgi:hypothetical protein